MGEIFTVDGHADTMLRVLHDEDYDFFAKNKKGHIDWERLKEAGVNLQVMAVFVERQYKPFQSLPRTIEVFGAFYRLMDRAPGELMLIKSKEDLEKLYRDREKRGLLLSLEGAEALFSEEALYVFYNLGLRLVTLTWNQRNQLADGVGENENAGGLTHLGRKMVERMSDLGVGVDVAHLSEKSFWDVLNCYSGPVIDSHSNAYAICDHRRNLKDEQIEAIAQTGGIIGINFSSFFLNGKSEAHQRDVLRHIDYIGEKFGFDCLGLGSDFDGIRYPARGLDDVTALPELGQKLRKRYGEEIMLKIMGENWRRVMQQFLPGC